MVSITVPLEDELSAGIRAFSWVNWSELAREELILQEKLSRVFERAKEIVSKSKFTEEDANKLADKVKLAMLKQLKSEGLV